MNQVGVELTGLHQVALGVGDLTRLLEQTQAPETGGSVLYLLVADIHQAHELLAGQGVVFDSDPSLIHRDEAGTFGEAGEEEWMTFFRDPDGNSIALATRR